MRTSPAFTLIELLVVISIIGILSTIAIAQFSRARAQAEVGQTKVIVSDVGKSIEAFRAQEQTAGRIIVPRMATILYHDPNMAGTAADGSYNSGGASSSNADGNGSYSRMDMFTGSESTQPGSLSYGFKFIPQKIPDYIAYYGTTPFTTDSQDTLGSLEGNFTIGTSSYPKCYVFEAYLASSLTGNVDNAFYFVRNGHLATFNIPNQYGGASCVSP